MRYSGETAWFKLPRYDRNFLWMLVNMTACLEVAWMKARNWAWYKPIYQATMLVLPPPWAYLQEEAWVRCQAVWARTCPTCSFGSAVFPDPNSCPHSSYTDTCLYRSRWVPPPLLWFGRGGGMLPIHLTVLGVLKAMWLNIQPNYGWSWPKQIVSNTWQLSAPRTAYEKYLSQVSKQNWQ